MDASRFHLSNMYPPLPSHNRRRLIMDYVDNKRHQLALLFFLFFLSFPPPPQCQVSLIAGHVTCPLLPLCFLINPPFPDSPGEASVSMVTGLSPIHVGMRRGYTWRPQAFWRWVNIYFWRVLARAGFWGKR